MAKRTRSLTQGQARGDGRLHRPLLPRPCRRSCAAATAQEIKAITILEMEIEDAAAKVRSTGVSDDEEDYALPVWCAVNPLRTSTWRPGGMSPPASRRAPEAGEWRVSHRDAGSTRRCRKATEPRIRLRTVRTPHRADQARETAAWTTANRTSFAGVDLGLRRVAVVDTPGFRWHFDAESRHTAPASSARSGQPADG